MKRLLPLIPILLLFLVNSCNSVYPTDSTKQTAEAAMSQLATLWTLTPTFTANPNIPDMVDWLNNDFSNANTLDRTMDAEYQLTNISIINPSGSALVFRMDVGCICMHTTDCCIPERTFVIVIEAMKRNHEKAIAQVPVGINEILVVCYDHTTDTQIGSISAFWEDVRNYLQGNASGHQLGVKVTRTVAP